VNDLRFAFRQLLKNPGFTAIAVLTLALGIGANTAMFSVVNAVLLRPLPFQDPEKLITLWERNDKQGYNQNLVAPANFADWKAQNQSFEQIAIFETSRGLNLTGAEEPVRVIGFKVSANLFSLLGVSPLHGRGFLPEEETPGRDRTVVLSHGLWQRRFGGHEGVIGQAISLDGESYTIVGIMPKGFVFPGATGEFLGGLFSNPCPDLWRPLAISAEMWDARSWHDWQVIGRLKPSVSLAQARVEMDTLMQRMEQANPGQFMGTHCTLVPLREQSVGSVRASLLVLLGAVGCVLLIGCANVANLFLARAAAREKEFAIRAALGAGRLAILRQLLTESVLLAVIGGVLGSLVAWWGVDVLAANVGGNIAVVTPGWNDIGVDGRVLAFTLALALGTGILFGLAPAWQTANTEVNESLKESGRGSTEGFQRQRLRGALVVAEVALAMVLLVGAGLLLQSLLRLQRVNPGFNPSRVLTMQLGLPRSRFPEDRHRAAFVERLCERLKILPGVEFVGATSGLPLTGDRNNYSYEVVGRPPMEPGKWETADTSLVTPDYLRVLQIPLVAGRSFDARDSEGVPLVCLINQAIAQRHFPNEDPVGKKLRLGYGNLTPEIIGVVPDIKHWALDKGSGPRQRLSLNDAGIYIPYAQEASWSTMTVALRTTGEPMDLAGAVRSVVRELDKNQPIAKMRTMETIVSGTLAQPRFRTLLIGLFGALAVVLAAIGIYGVVSYNVTQRTHEFGIRMALGAQTKDVLRLVMRHGMILAVVGISVGALGTLALTRVISALLFGVRATDPLTFAGVAVLLGLIAFLACVIPARRATKVEPMEALRYE
jgi:putative ABC transport system permease protein